MELQEQGFTVDERESAPSPPLDESALLPQEDAIFEGTGADHRRPDVEFRGPCLAEVVGHRVHKDWLGFRIGPSEWPGYLRLGFATDLGFNIATLDIHHSQFDRLKKGIERVQKGLNAGIQLSPPGELHSRQVRRQAGALLLELGEGASQITVLDLNHQSLLKAKLYTPDLKLSLERITPAFDTIQAGPDRRSLRTGKGADVVMDPQYGLDIEQMSAPPAEPRAQVRLPEYWVSPKDKPEILDLVTLNLRNDERFHDLTLDLRSVNLITERGMFPLIKMAFDFSEFPVRMALDYLPPGQSRPKTLMCNFLKDDYQVLRDTAQNDLWSIRQANRYRTDIPMESRAMIIETLRAPMKKYKEVHHNYSRLQTQLYFGPNFEAPIEQTFEALDLKANEKRLRDVAKEARRSAKAQAVPGQGPSDAPEPTPSGSRVSPSAFLPSTQYVASREPSRGESLITGPTNSEADLLEPGPEPEKHLPAFVPDLR